MESPTLTMPTDASRSPLPDDVRGEMRMHRLDLLRREAEHAERTRAIRMEVEGASPPASPELLSESRRTERLAAEALRLGVRDTHRVGASLRDLVSASSLDEAAIRRILTDAGVDPEEVR